MYFGDTHTNAYSDSYSYGDSYGNSYGNSNVYSDGYGYVYSDAYRNCNCDSYGHSYSYCYCNACGNGNALCFNLGLLGEPSRCVVRSNHTARMPGIYQGPSDCDHTELYQRRQNLCTGRTVDRCEA